MVKYKTPTLRYDEGTKGDQFLPDVSIDELRKLHRKEKNAKAGGMLLAYMARKNGSSVRAVARSLNRSSTTTYD